MTSAAAPAGASGRSLADGEWHRLMRVTPLLKGGFALIALLGFLIAQFRERLLAMLFGGGGYPEDPIDRAIDSGWLPAGLGIAILVIALFVGLFSLSWWMHTFRVTDELVEVRSGVLSRTHRRARLDRIQGIATQRKLFARLFGAARLEIQVAGNDANVTLEYLRSAEADALRREILRRASGASAPAAEQARAEGLADAAAPGVLETRAREFIAPERDPSIAPPESVVDLHPGRLIGSELLGPRTFWFVVLIAGIVVVSLTTDAVVIIVSVVPALIGLVSVTVRRVVRSLRYSIAGTPDGVRVGFGLLSTTNETLPPGRIHSISVSQPLSWRPFGWWRVRVNRASRSRNDREQQTSEVLPVGDRADALKVLRLLLPELSADELQPLLESGFSGDTGGGYTTSPPRAAVLRWFSWRRNGFALVDPVVLLRRGAIWRELVIVPFARMQSVAVRQGPLLRRLRLAEVHVHTVAGPISPRLGALDVRDVEGLFRRLADDSVAAAAADRSQHWGRTASGGETDPAGGRG